MLMSVKSRSCKKFSTELILSVRFFHVTRYELQDKLIKSLKTHFGYLSKLGKEGGPLLGTSSDLLLKK